MIFVISLPESQDFIFCEIVHSSPLVYNFTILLNRQAKDYLDPWIITDDLPGQEYNLQWSRRIFVMIKFGLSSRYVKISSPPAQLRSCQSISFFTKWRQMEEMSSEKIHLNSSKDLQVESGQSMSNLREKWATRKTHKTPDTGDWSPPS